MNRYTIDGANWNFGIKSFSDAASSITINFSKSDLTGPEELAAKFPKYCKARISGVTCRTEESYRTVCFCVSLATNKVTGKVNETAVKRRAKILSILNDLVL
tara:strand:+ start:179 stop:484 length:306 start_codon:yes stop_codon:yes gene_type:complete